ncbi:MAG TPA: CehA/McbA family metallohydrolase [Candidatus Eisenbacteria bacterium]|nr:CehA/McbA family metallohydrolase [Candidatus Eisenbacteria bacterium]
MRRTVGWVWLVVGLLGITLPVLGQRRPVLGQIDEPHPYYYRELYLPELTSGPSSVCWGPGSDEVIYSMGGSLWRQKLDSREAVQLTDGPGYDYQPDWSPDGKSVVYVSYQKDAMELWLLEVATGKTTQLTSGRAVNVEPRWSPDGRKIVWVSTQFHRRFHVFEAGVSHGKLEKVARLTGETKSSLPRYYYSAYDMEISPTWTRDGKEILYVSNRGHIYGSGGFWRMEARPGAAAREIHYEETSWKARPDFSPDGSRMVYSSYLGRQWQTLWVMPAKGGDAFPISYAEWDETNPRWSPDGNKIAGISNQPGGTEIFWQTIPGAERHLLRIETRKALHPQGQLEIKLAQAGLFSNYARMSVVDEHGRFHAPDDAWIFADDGFDRKEQAFEAHYFYPEENHEVTLEVPSGKIRVRVSRGMREKPFEQTVEVKAGETQTVTVDLRPMEFETAGEGHWVASDLHVHMNYGGTYRNYVSHLWTQAVAEGLEVINELIVNKEQRIPDDNFVVPPRTEPSDWEAVLVKGQEYHTSYWGHRGILDLKEHLLLPGYAVYPGTAAASPYPMNADVYDMAHAQGALVGAVHPFDSVPDPFAKPAQKITDELPVDVALGKLDYMEIVGFSDHKSTAEVWYRLLNLGFKLPAGGGTDATTNYTAPIRGQIGFDRVYVWTPEWPANVGTWKDGLRQGRTFATNGPLVGFTLGGQRIGSELQFHGPQAGVPFTAKLRSIVPVEHLEVVCNGKVMKALLTEARDTGDFSGEIPLNESGWCVLRAWSNEPQWPVMDSYAYGTTSPVYVRIAGKRAYSKTDAKYFEAWIDRTMETTSQYPDWNSAEEKAKVMERLREARQDFEDLR